MSLSQHTDIEAEYQRICDEYGDAAPLYSDYKEQRLRETKELELNQEEMEEELWNADPECKHNIVAQPRGGVKCAKCGGWYCY